MSEVKHVKFSFEDEDGATEEEELSSKSPSTSNLQLEEGEGSFNHPNVPVTPPVSASSRKLEKRTHDGIASDAGFPEEELALNFSSRSPMSDSGIPTETKMASNPEETKCQSLSLPEEASWMETDRSIFITQRIQNLVQAFHARAEKVKEKIVQPPTPSPSPPPENSETDDSPEPKTRPRLQSLIHQEDIPSDLEYQNETLRLWCCVVQRKFIPTFPKVIDPQSKLYISWLFFVMVSYVYNAWVIVLRAVFPYQTSDNLSIFLVFDYAADIIYVIDIALFKVRLQFLHDGFWVDNPEKTKKHYFNKTMFKMDLLSLLPLDLLYFIYGINPLFRLPRLLKTQTFWEFFHRVDAVAKTPYVIRIIRTLLYMMYLVHLNACAYYAMSRWEGIGSNRWVFQGDGNAYIRCFYFATKTATSIGKNPKPENEYEYVFMTVSWLMGVFIFAFLIGQIRDIVATATQSKTQYRQLMDQTVMYMRNLNLPDDLQRRVRLWLNHTWEQQKTLNESGILDSLPRKMKTDVAINVHYNTLVKVQLFKDCDKALLRDLVLQLKPVLFLPGDYICRKGEVGKEMYIVNKGLVQVRGGENGDIVLATLSEGSVFGEISLLGIPGCSRRTADVRSQGFSNLFVLSKDDLWEALKNYPEAQKVLRKKAKSLIKENEARDNANRNNNVANVKPEVIIKHDSKRSSTPQLVKAIIQMVPKDSKCAQYLSRTSIDITEDPCKPTPASTSPVKKSPEIPDKRCQRATKSNSAVVPRSQGFHSGPSKQRSLSDGTIRPCTEPTKGSPSKTKLQNKNMLQNILNLIPHRSAVHPASEDVNPPKPNTNSEDSGISLDNRTPQKPEDDSISTCASDTSSEMSATSTKRTAESSPHWVSTPSSVMSLRGLFATESSESSSTNKDSLASVLPQDDTEGTLGRPHSLTSDSSSTGYDNLEFVPVSLLSRRSSIFSDTSC